MNVYTLLFLFVGLSVFFFLLVWVVVSTYRICFPEKQIPFHETARQFRLLSFAGMDARRMTVGVHRYHPQRSISAREIRSSHRRRQQTRAREPVQYIVGEGTVPETWREELWIRRN